jgi:hypothetical protein
MIQMTAPDRLHTAAELAQQEAPKGGGNLPPPLQAEPVEEPVAWRHKGAGHFTVTPLVSKFPEWEPLYTAPPRREWQELTEKEINDGRDQLPTEDLCGWSFRQGVYFAEKALKERNNG